MGTRRLEEILTDARAQAYSEDYSLTEGWNDNVAARIANLGLNRLYHAITQIENPAHVEQYSADIVSGQQAYDLPIDVFMALRIIDVRYIWGTQNYEFLELQQGMIQDRLDYPINIPSIFCIRNGQILLSPAPNLSKTNGLQINFQKRMRSLDVRRGRILSKTDAPATYTITFGDAVTGYSIGTGLATYTGNLAGSPIVAGTLTLTDGTLTVTDDGSGNLIGNIGAGTNTINYSTGAYDVTFSGVTTAVTASYTANSSSKNSKMQEYSENLDSIDYICLVDRDGESIISEIPVQSYNSTTRVIVAETSYTMPATQLAALDAALAAGTAVYVTEGRYSSTHSQLDSQCEDYLIEFIISRLLRLQSSTSELSESRMRENEAMESLINAYRRYRKTIYPVRWVNNRSGYSLGLGSRGIY